MRDPERVCNLRSPSAAAFLRVYFTPYLREYEINLRRARARMTRGQPKGNPELLEFVPRPEGLHFWIVGYCKSASGHLPSIFTSPLWPRTP